MTNEVIRSADEAAKPVYKNLEDWEFAFENAGPRAKKEEMEALLESCPDQNHKFYFWIEGWLECFAWHVELEKVMV